MIPRPFDYWTTYVGHAGIDYPAPTGTIIRAAEAGRITFAGWHNDRSGWRKDLDLGNGIVERYYHLHSLAGPAEGSRVASGQSVGLVGSTGYMSTGPHLHHEVWVYGRLMAPPAYWNYISSRAWVGQARPALTTLPLTLEDITMRFLFCKDRSGTGNLWTLLNTSTGEMRQTRSQDEANRWAEAWGSARVVSVDAFTEALRSVELTTGAAA